MPPQIGNFISAAVYENQLQSNPLHPITDKTIACRLIDVTHGKQQTQGTSFKVCDYVIMVYYSSENPYVLQNIAELDVALQIAEQLQIQGKNFRIITPYDAQRSALEEGMKEHELNWEDKCFNVDSFQGQIPISLYLSGLIHLAVNRK
jgi:regulator of nonsense transcripts 1